MVGMTWWFRMPTRRPPLTPRQEGEQDLSDLQRAARLYRTFKRLEGLGIFSISLGGACICLLVLFWDIFLLLYLIPLIACLLIFGTIAAITGFRRSSDILIAMVEGSERFRKMLVKAMEEDLENEEKIEDERKKAWEELGEDDYKEPFSDE